MPASSILVRYSSATEASSSPSSLRIDSSCLRRKYSRCCFSAPDWTSSRIRLRTWSSASRSRWSVTAFSSRSRDVERLEQLDLLGLAQVGRVAGGVGERAGLGDRAQEGADAVVGLAQLEDLLDHGAVLALELSDPLVRPGPASGCAVDLDPQVAAAVGAGVLGRAAVEALHGHRLPAAGDPHPLEHLGHDPDRGELAVAARDQENRSSSPTSRARVAVMPGKIRASSRGTSSRVSISISFIAFKVLG